MTLLHLLSYVGSVVAFLFVTLSLGEYNRASSEQPEQTQVTEILKRYSILLRSELYSERSIMAGRADRRTLEDGESDRDAYRLREFRKREVWIQPEPRIRSNVYFLFVGLASCRASWESTSSSSSSTTSPSPSSPSPSPPTRST
jgi:hypothetical protein